MFHFKQNKLADKDIGRGEFGVVYPYRKSKEDKRWVVKCINVKTLEELSQFMQSVVLGFNQSHPNILRVAGYRFKEDAGANKLYVKMPRARESLRSKIDRSLAQGEDPNVQEIIAHLYDSTKALEYLESKGIAHQALRPGNILIDNQGKAMISDIGMARGQDKSYCAPEVVLSDVSTLKKDKLAKADVWSLGVIIIELCLLEPESMSSVDGGDKVKENLKINLEQINRKYGIDLSSVLARMTEIDPEERISFKEVRAYLEKQFVGLDREPINEEEFQGKSFEEGEQDQKEEMKENEPEDNKNEEKEEDYKKLSSLDPVKVELQEKWEKHFKFDSEEQWAVRAQNPSNITDVELDIFLLDVSEKLKENDASGDIKKLILDFTNCNQFSNTGMVHIANHISTNFTNVSELKLDFGGCDQINDTGMTQLMNQISQQLVSLKHLSLDFSYWINITDAGTAHLTTYFANLSELKCLKLNFNYTNLTDNAVTQIVNEIGNSLAKLRRLALNFAGCLHVTDTGLSHISTNISRQLPELQHLAINVSFCTAVTDVGVMYFANNAPRHLKKLKHLTMDFGGCSDITDKGVTSLATHIAKSLKNLQQLVLDFQACTKVTDKPKKLLKQTLSFIPKIEIK